MINCYGVNDESQLMTSDLHLFVNWIDVELVSNAGDEILRIFIYIAQYGHLNSCWSLRSQQSLSIVDPVVDYEKSPFFLRDSRASETRARVKITQTRKGDTRRGEGKMIPNPVEIPKL